MDERKTVGRQEGFGRVRQGRCTSRIQTVICTRGSLAWGYLIPNLFKWTSGGAHIQDIQIGYATRPLFGLRMADTSALQNWHNIIRKQICDTKKIIHREGVD